MQQVEHPLSLEVQFMRGAFRVYAAIDIGVSIGREWLLGAHHDSSEGDDHEHAFAIHL